MKKWNLINCSIKTTKGGNMSKTKIETKSKGIKWKTITKKMVINPNILKTTLNVNGLNH